MPINLHNWSDMILAHISMKKIKNNRCFSLKKQIEISHYDKIILLANLSRRLIGANLSRRLIGELIGYLWSGVILSSVRRQHFQTSTKSHYFVLICQNLPICNPKTLLSNINSYTKFDENWLKLHTEESENKVLTD